MSGIRKNLHDGLASAFAKWGRVVAKWPVRVLFLSLTCYIALCAGLVRLTSETRSYYLWVPTSSRAYAEWQYQSARFGVVGHSLVVYAKAKSGNVFDRASIEQLLAAHKYTIELQTEVNGRIVRFSDACRRLEGSEGSECFAPSFLSLWDYKAGPLDDSDELILQKLTQYHQASSIETFSGNVVLEEKNGNVEVKGAEAVVLVFPLASEDGASYDIQPAWNEGIAGAVDGDVLEVAHLSNRSYDDEISRLVTGDIPLFIIGLAVICAFVSCTLGPLRSLHRSRVLLGVMATVNVLLSVGGGFGIASVIGIRFASISALLPLIVLGVEVDSIIIMVDALNAEPASDPLEERIANSLSRSGPAMLVTSLTTICAFATSTTTAMPAVAMFASYAALSFTVGIFLMLSFFLPLLVLDERRLEASRVSFAPCVRVRAGGELPEASQADSNGEAAPAHALPVAAALPTAPPAKRARSNQASELRRVTAVQRLVRDRYAPALLSPVGSALVVLCCAALAVVSGLAVPHITVGLPLEDVLPDGSYVADAIAVERAIFKGQIYAASVVVRGEDYNSEETRDAYARAREAIAGLDFVTLVQPDWLSSYAQWRALTGKSGEFLDGFLDHLHDFLHADGFTVFQTSVACESEASCVAPTDTRFTAVFRTGTGDAIKQLVLRDAMEAELRAEGFADSFVWAEGFMGAESDRAIWHLTWTNMVYAVAAILGVMIVFSPLPIAAWITVCVALIDLDLLGAIWAFGLQLNAVTYVNLVMAVGLSVDYCVHIAHAFNDAHHSVAAEAGSPSSAKNSATYALTTMGSAIFKGGFTTILGVLVIAFASSVAFRTFFTMISCTVALGMLHGMALLPVLLAYATVLPPRCRGK